MLLINLSIATGLACCCLRARVALYLVFALNVSGDPGVNLLAICVITSSILFLNGHVGRIYQKKHRI